MIAVSDGSLEAPIDSQMNVSLPVDALHIFDKESSKAVLHGMETA